MSGPRRERPGDDGDGREAGARRRQICAWCRQVVDEGTTGQVTHVMCRSCATRCRPSRRPERRDLREEGHDGDGVAWLDAPAASRPPPVG